MLSKKKIVEQVFFVTFEKTNKDILKISDNKTQVSYAYSTYLNGIFAVFLGMEGEQHYGRTFKIYFHCDGEREKARKKSY